MVAPAGRRRAPREMRSGGALRQDLPDLLRPFDWDNLLEELEALDSSEHRELSSHIATVIEHLTKLECSPATLPHRFHGRNTIGFDGSEIRSEAMP